MAFSLHYHPHLCKVNVHTGPPEKGDAASVRRARVAWRNATTGNTLQQVPESDLIVVSM